jgi:hypothetical protein
MDVNPFEHEVLRRIADDYESPETIVADISRVPGVAGSSARFSDLLTAWWLRSAQLLVLEGR